VCCRDFSLSDHLGAERSIKDFRGKVVVLTFGFTHCPDVCPTTLADMSKGHAKLGPDARRVQVCICDLDPERDTAEVLAKYVSTFDRTFVGLRGSTDVVAKTAKDFRVSTRNRPGSRRMRNLVDHTWAVTSLTATARPDYLSHIEKTSSSSVIFVHCFGEPAAAPHKTERKCRCNI
jgi:cytochrome oxidase Cu insertion factor (SCO1/SenC/PrrC family)